MSVFFVGWELWQEMTFVLACCIILVFFLGVLRLWRTNRALRRLEIIDEEKRSRLSMLSHCGINAKRPSEIPFGVRAIQNGVEVDGIWISRRDTPDLSRITTSPTLFGTTTLVADQTATSKGKERMTDFSSSQGNQDDLTPEGLSTGFPATLASSNTPHVVSASNESCSNPSDQISDPSSSSRSQPNSSNSPPASKGNHSVQHKSDTPHPTDTNPFTTPSDTPTLDSFRLASCRSSEAEPSITESTLHRTTEVIINRNFKRANRLCAVVPAGSGKQIHGKKGEGSGNNGRARPRVLKLNKKPSFARLREQSTDLKEQLLTEPSLNKT